MRARGQSPNATRVHGAVVAAPPNAGERRTSTTATPASRTVAVAITPAASMENSVRARGESPRGLASTATLARQYAAKPPVVPASTSAERRGMVRERAVSTAHAALAAATARTLTVSAVGASSTTEVTPTVSASATADTTSTRTCRDRGADTAMHSMEGASTIAHAAIARAIGPPTWNARTYIAVDPTDSTPAMVVTRRKKCRGARLPSCGRITPIMLTPSATHITASPIDSTMDPPRHIMLAPARAALPDARG